MATNPYVNKVVYGSTTLIDISDTTATADKILQGYTAYGANGQKLTGTATGGGTGSVWQDAQGKVHFSPTGGGGGGATPHVIHFEFTDSTDTDINVYYDDSLIGTMITAYTPETYGQKTVDSASLDGTTWYTRPTEQWETIFNNNVDYYMDDNNPYPYCWITDLGNVQIPLNTLWRVTVDNTEYRCVAGTMTIDYHIHTYIGNAKWSTGIDDGNNAPFSFYNSEYGAWSGSIDKPNLDSTYHIKIERQIIA